ncbi:MAG: helix-turn-helix transcriptional regulator [Nitrospira sp.]|jgi:transcriptional regulator with XRE-family HTH domain
MPKPTKASASAKMNKASRTKKMKQAYIAQLETGTEANPTLDTLRRLARALKTTVGALVG